MGGVKHVAKREEYRKDENNILKMARHGQRMKENMSNESERRKKRRYQTSGKKRRAEMKWLAVANEGKLKKKKIIERRKHQAKSQAKDRRIEDGCVGIEEGRSEEEERKEERRKKGLWKENRKKISKRRADMTRKGRYMYVTC